MANPKTTKIYVGNLPELCTDNDLKDLFSRFGRVEECDMVKNFGFVHMSSEKEAKASIEALNNTEFLGVRISVEVSHSKVRPKPGMGGKGQCYRCGKSGHWSKECPRNNINERGNIPPPLLLPPPPMSYDYFDRYENGSRYGPMRHHPMDRVPPRRNTPYDRPMDRPFDRRYPPPDTFDRRPPPSLGPLPMPFDDYYRPPPPPPPHFDDYGNGYRRSDRNDRYGDFDRAPPPDRYDRRYSHNNNNSDRRYGDC